MRGKLPTFSVIVWGGMLLLAGSAMWACGEEPDFASRFAERLRRVQNVTATFRQETVFTPPTAIDQFVRERAKERGENAYFYRGLYVETGAFEFLDGRAIYKTEYAPETVKRFDSEGAVFVRRTVRSYALDRSESLVVHARSGHAAGVISDSEQIINYFPIDIALGLRCPQEQNFLEPRRAATGHWERGSDPARVALRLEDTAAPQVSHIWEFDTAEPSAIRSCKRVLKDGFVSVDVECSEFQSYSGASLPTLVVAKYLTPTPDGPHVVRTITVRVSEYAVTPSGNTPDKYHMLFPAGSLINESRLGVPLRAATTRSFSDQEIFEAAKQRDAKMGPPVHGGNWGARAVFLALTLVLVMALAWRLRTAGKASKASVGAS